MAPAPKYYIKGNLSEKQIEADVATFMGWCTPITKETPFRLLDVDEQRTGADKLFDQVIPIYIQFKKSFGLRSVAEIKPSTRRRRSALEDIREFRAKHGLQDDPTLFFQLRAKTEGADDFQHNILLKYENPPWSRAIYVAPLVFDKLTYHSLLFQSADRFLLDPFYQRIHYRIHQLNWVSHFGAVPFLREHISIPPHERVDNHNHYYAFSETGFDLSWHSPEIIEGEPRRLSDFLVKLFRGAVTDLGSMTPSQALVERISDISRNAGFDGARIHGNESAMDYLGRHAKWLLNTYGIRQLLLLGNSEHIAEIRNRL